MAPAERLYLSDSKLTRFRATVTGIREFARRDGVQVWHISLDRTAFYPTGGGQPHDRGFLRAQSRSGAVLEAAVEDVIEDEGGEIWHATTKPLLAGTEIEGVIDEARRLDHRQQHSGQHLLSAIFANQHQAKTVGFHLGDDDVTIDLAVPDKQGQEALMAQLQEVEEEVNRHIAGNLLVSVREVSNEEARDLLASGAVRKLPPREGPIRLVEIPGLDLNACGGTHVAALGEIGSVLLRQTERTKGGLRLHFVCGLRAVRHARASFEALGAAAKVLSVGPAQAAEAALRLKDQLKALSKERAQLREELAADHAVRLAVEERIVDGLRLVARTYPDRNAEYVKLLAGKLMEAVPHTSAVLASTAEEPATLFCACNQHPDLRCDVILRELLLPFGLRAGGTASLAQARVPAAALPQIMERVTASMRSAPPPADDAADQLQ